MSVSIELTSHEHDADDIRKIRQAVFVEEQGIDPLLEWDELDVSAKFIIARDKTAAPVGTARFFTDGKVGRMAVLNKWRNQGIGTAMLQEVIRYARQTGINKLHLSAQESAIPFYEKNGFSCQGDSYYEAGILHQDMILSLMP